MPIEPLESVDPDQLLELSAHLRRVAGALASQAAQDEPTGARPDVGWVIRIIRARRLREQYFDSGLFADAAWDILLELYAARLQGKRVAVSSLCIAAGVPATTALRWISLLEQKGHVCRSGDPADGRRIYVALTDASADRMSRLLGKCRSISDVVL